MYQTTCEVFLANGPSEPKLYWLHFTNGPQVGTITQSGFKESDGSLDKIVSLLRDGYDSRWITYVESSCPEDFEV